MNEDIEFRLAQENDLVSIVGLLSNDLLGSKRESFSDPLPESYVNAFKKINADPNHELNVAVSNEKVIACFQLNFLQYLTYQGGLRAQIEAIRVDEAYRNMGIGRLIFEYAIDRAKVKEAHVLQLTTDKQRPDAHRFYESLGFIASHEGMKLHLK